MSDDTPITRRGFLNRLRRIAVGATAGGAIGGAFGPELAEAAPQNEGRHINVWKARKDGAVGGAILGGGIVAMADAATHGELKADPEHVPEAHGRQRQMEYWQAQRELEERSRNPDERSK